MSFILDALRRTDREQKNGLNPGLETVIQVPQRPPAPRRTPWLAAVAILSLGAGASMLLLWPFGGPEPLPAIATTPPAAPPPPAQPEPRSAAERPIPPTRRPAILPAQAEPAPPPVARAGAERPSQTLRQPPAAASASNPALAARGEDAGIPVGGSLETAVRERGGKVPATRRSPPAAQRDDADQAEGTRPAPTPVQITPARPPSPEPVAAEESVPVVAAAPETKAAPARPPGPAPPQREAVDTTTPKPAPDVPPRPAPAPAAPAGRATPVADLPPTQRAPFEEIRLDAHVYADDPSQRFVLIRMRGHRVGDSVGVDGPVLEAITPEGAVLRSGSVRALVPHP